MAVCGGGSSNVAGSFGGMIGWYAGTGVSCNINWMSALAEMDPVCGFLSDVWSGNS